MNHQKTIRHVILSNEASKRKVRESDVSAASFFIDVRKMISEEKKNFNLKKRKTQKTKSKTPFRRFQMRSLTIDTQNLSMDYSNAYISTYLQIDQETNSRRDDSSSRNVSVNHLLLYRFCLCEIFILSISIMKDKRSSDNYRNKNERIKAMSSV